MSSDDVAPLMKTANVAENSGHCIYSIGLMCFLNCLSLLHLVICTYIYIYICILLKRENNVLNIVDVEPRSS